MTKRPSMQRRLPRFPFVLRSAPGTPGPVAGPQSPGKRRRRHPERMITARWTTFLNRSFLPGCRSNRHLQSPAAYFPHRRRPASHGFLLVRLFNAGRVAHERHRCAAARSEKPSTKLSFGLSSRRSACKKPHRSKRLQLITVVFLKTMAVRSNVL